MMLDMVHDIQSVYRKLVHSMSRPGTITNLSEEAEKLDNQGVFPSTQLIARTLLDTEVTFSIVSSRAAEITSLFSQMTYAKEAAIEAADYIFVLEDAVSGAWLETIQAAKVGELIDPHAAATIIFEVEDLFGGTTLRLSGPGILTTASIAMNMREDWVELRADRNSEFPLGVDLLFTDVDHRVLALPRTTQVVKEEV
ncbi:alpha-D-ribose 1-methylphosphonate 5-triphosphate synthase subunit PhnH [Paenibacillus sp. PastF-3]|uniref:phosphonate C-P lyase system protein PhnH n=1 Tax=Paenibacillus sp. PastF-3 TaxID=2940626 RepID=UPI002476EFD6|nr:phosphonate C-P lyase system protein PhnH [Paenibacillus sp. PastF-3]MDH6374061.1 alpha-D-ribose 1-methylphosphonate 5-triphosphate synthase subunit PhnH [Paenibacillus sp. PastF-3]